LDDLQVIPTLWSSQQGISSFHRHRLYRRFPNGV
jgi:hypothetical protein